MSYKDKRIFSFAIHQNQIKDFGIKPLLKTKLKINKCTFFNKKMEDKEEQDKKELNIKVNISSIK